jgi:hypothetical protein
MATFSAKDVGRTVLALGLPFVLFTAGLVAAEQVRAVSPTSLGVNQGVSMLVAAAAGFFILPQRMRVHSIGVAVVYFPVMFLLLFNWALWVVGYLYGDFL